MTDKKKDITRRLHVLTQDNGDKKDKTSLELFFEADQMLVDLYDLIEEAQETYDDAKEVLFAEAGFLKEVATVPQLKG